MTDLPALSSERPLAAATPLVPLAYVHPGLSMPQLFSILWAYRGLSAMIIVLVLAATAVAMWLWPRTYSATAALMVNYEVSDPLNGKELPVGQVGSYIATQVELMQTPELLLAVVDRLRLTERPAYARGWRSETGTLRDWAAAQVARTLVVEQSQRGSQLIYASFSSDDAAEAAQVANTVADVYKEQDLLRAGAAPGDRAKRYAQQLDELKAKAEQAQRDLTAFHQRNGLIEETDKSGVDVLLLAAMDERLLAAQNERRAAEARAAQNQAVGEQVLASPLTQQLKAQLATQELRLDYLRKHYTPLYPDVADMEAQVAATRRALAANVKSYSDGAAAGLGVARRLEKGFERSLDEQRGKVLARSLLQDEAAKYRLELASAQAVYKRALESYDQIMFAASARQTNVSLVSRATPPVKASRPRVLLGWLFGVLCAGVLGFGIPLAYELFNRRVRCRDDIERQWGVPVLAEFGRLPLRVST
ncbi:Wzz/FepE/Etk N-terminal domain-containing protein [uncultured Piscinibacter sp.]|uniref:GumC family protein n=1 Tax=uncultured Piscinibacter sp. TaxID=1131835 RepID=UPI002618D8A6|nr:Wzz/FepE/Etk N-terminal domain-containing protein [uncultured Piscinibacter sp.]